jgi:hypothetical protein
MTFSQWKRWKSVHGDKTPPERPETPNVGQPRHEGHGSNEILDLELVHCIICRDNKDMKTLPKVLTASHKDYNRASSKMPSTSQDVKRGHGMPPRTSSQ